MISRKYLANFLEIILRNFLRDFWKKTFEEIPWYVIFPIKSSLSLSHWRNFWRNLLSNSGSCLWKNPWRNPKEILEEIPGNIAAEISEGPDKNIHEKPFNVFQKESLQFLEKLLDKLLWRSLEKSIGKFLEVEYT